jgi:hypothetical protein
VQRYATRCRQAIGIVAIAEDRKKIDHDRVRTILGDTLLFQPLCFGCIALCCGQQQAHTIASNLVIEMALAGRQSLVKLA